ncbi:hypothetical protein CR513_01445, partial [Mucuna pruriens]
MERPRRDFPPSIQPLEPLYPKNYDPNAKCDYHAGVIGHPTEKCWGLKHKVQDLIEGGSLGFKENEPNVYNNLLPAHGGQSVNALSHECLKHEPSETGSSQTHFAQVAIIGQAGDLLPKSLII